MAGRDRRRLIAKGLAAPRRGRPPWARMVKTAGPGARVVIGSRYG